MSVEGWWKVTDVDERDGAGRVVEIYATIGVSPDPALFLRRVW